MKLALILAAVALPAQTFEVASIRPNKSDEQIDYHAYADHLIVKNMSLKGLIETAFGAKDFQVVAPAWASVEKFDVAAKAPGKVPFSELILMFQALLADRFQLRSHREMRDSTVYSLVVARGGIRMKLSTDQTLYAGDYPDGRPLKGGSPSVLSPGHIGGEEVPMNYPDQPAFLAPRTHCYKQHRLKGPLRLRSSV